MNRAAAHAPSNAGRLPCEAGDEGPPCDRRQTARALADAIDDAMHRGQWGLAERLAASAARAAPDNARLTERLARLKLALGEADAALHILDACMDQPASLRMLRIATLMQAGRRAEAHLALAEWCRRSTAPLQARLLLGLLDWDIGDPAGARLALLKNLRHVEDPATLLALVMLSVEEGRRDQAREWAGRWLALQGNDEARSRAMLLVEPLGLDLHPAAVHHSPQQLRILVMELVADEALIPAIAAAQAIAPDAFTTRLLDEAVGLAAGDLEEPATACEALAAMHLVHGHLQAAERWCHKGLSYRPMHAGCARVLREVEVVDANLQSETAAAPISFAIREAA